MPPSIFPFPSSWWCDLHLPPYGHRTLFTCPCLTNFAFNKTLALNLQELNLQSILWTFTQFWKFKGTWCFLYPLYWFPQNFISCNACNNSIPLDFKPFHFCNVTFHHPKHELVVHHIWCSINLNIQSNKLFFHFLVQLVISSFEVGDLPKNLFKIYIINMFWSYISDSNYYHSTWHWQKNP